MSVKYIFYLLGVVLFSLVIVLVVFYYNGRIIEESYDDGSLKARYHYKKGVIEGYYQEFYQNGNTKLESRYLNGVLVDTLRAYFENGVLSEISHFKNGKKNGFYEDYYSNGKLKSQGWASDGYKDSVFTYYSEKGETDSIIWYRKGEIEIRATFGDGLVNYQDFRYNYSLNFPQNWEFDLAQTEAVLVIKNTEGKKPGDYTESLNITFYQHEPSMDINEFISSYMLSMKQDIPSFNALDVNYTTDDRCEIRFTATYGERYLEALVTIVYGKDEAYMITCTADQMNFKAVDNTFKQISDSFRKIMKMRQNLILAHTTGAASRLYRKQNHFTS